MSQLVQFTTTGVSEVKTLTGDAGGAVSSLLSNINIIGGTNIQTVGTPLTNTININLSGTTDHRLQVGNLGGGLTSLAAGLTGDVLQGVTGGDPVWGPIAGLDATEVLTGFVRLATDAEAIAGAAIVPNNVAIVPTSLKAKLGSQTLHGIPVGAGDTAAIAWTAEPSNGQILIGSTGNTPVLGTITAGTNIDVTNAAGSITVKVAGTTEHCIQVGSATGDLTSLAAGLTGQVLQGFTGGDPIWAASVVADATEVVYGAVRLATDAEAIDGSATVPENSAIVPTSLKAKLGTQTLHGIPTGAGDNAAIVWTAEPTDGQLLVGSTGNAPVLATITAGANIDVANAAGSITIKVDGTTEHCVQVGSATGDLTSLPAGLTGQVLQGNTGGDPTWAASAIVDATEVVYGAVRLATDAEAIAGAATVPANSAVVPTALKAKLGTQTLHGIPIGAGDTAAIAWTAEPTDGQLLVGSTGNAPVLAAITAGTNIGVANAAGSITIKVAGTTNHAVQIGNATGDLTSLAVGATGETIMGTTGANPGWTNSPSFGGSVTSVAGNISATAGSVSAGTTVVAGTGITATTGNIVATTGNINSTNGSVSANTTVTAGTNLVSTAGNLLLPTTTATVGQIQINASPVLHSYGTGNFFLGDSAGNFTLTTANSAYNVSVGARTLSSLTGDVVGKTANRNTAVGYSALRFNTGGNENTMCGYKAGYDMTDGETNSGFGDLALASVTTGVSNIGIGAQAGYSSITTGSYNILIGNTAGSSYTLDESSNILIGYSVAGTAGEDNVLRIGDGTGAGNGQLAAAYVSGIYNINADAGGTPHAVYIGSGNKLGKNPSSRKVKENIVNMSGSEVIYNLRPVNFNYIANPEKTKQWGLIAEEVAEVLPDLAGYDSTTGEPDSVRYEMLPVLLLNEVKKQQAIINDLVARIQALEARS